VEVVCGRSRQLIFAFFLIFMIVVAHSLFETHTATMVLFV
jgi:hypothetical protein